jgi:hypothetical protein
MPRVTEYATARMSLKVKAEVEKMAKADRRSLSNMLGILIEEALDHRKSAEEQKKSPERSPLMAEHKPLALNQ